MNEPSERAEIVAWLRQRAAEYNRYDHEAPDALEEAAEAIERGEHKDQPHD